MIKYLSKIYWKRKATDRMNHHSNKNNIKIKGSSLSWRTSNSNEWTDSLLLGNSLLKLKKQKFSQYQNLLKVQSLRSFRKDREVLMMWSVLLKINSNIISLKDLSFSKISKHQREKKLCLKKNYSKLMFKNRSNNLISFKVTPLQNLISRQENFKINGSLQKIIQ
jgi:hypothetical protein